MWVRIEDILHSPNHTSFGSGYAAKRIGIPSVTNAYEILGSFWNELAPRFSAWQFRLIVSGKLKRNLTNNIVVEESKPQKELFELICESKAVIVPSRSDGFGCSLVDACMIGEPVIASDAGSIPEVVFDRYQLFERGNPKELSECIKSGKFKRKQKQKMIGKKRPIKAYEEVYEAVASVK